MCRSVAVRGSHLLTFCARVRCANVERRSAVMCSRSVRVCQPNWRRRCWCRRWNIRRTVQPMIGSATPSRGSMCTSSRTMQPSGSSSRVRSCHQTRCHQLVEDSRKPRPSGKATSSTRWRSTGMKPSPSCQSTGVPTRHGSESKGAPPVGSVIRTNGATSRLMPPTVDTAAHTAERLARNVNSTVSRIAQSLAASDGELSNQCTQIARSGAGLPGPEHALNRGRAAIRRAQGPGTPIDAGLARRPDVTGPGSRTRGPRREGQHPSLLRLWPNDAALPLSARAYPKQRRRQNAP
jgi:hypothetical protein